MCCGYVLWEVETAGQDLTPVNESKTKGNAHRTTNTQNKAGRVITEQGRHRHMDKLNTGDLTQGYKGRN